MKQTSRRRFVAGAASLCTPAVTGCLSSGPDPEEEARRHRESLERFRDVSTALDAGYRSAAEYVRGPDGVIGTPFVDPSIAELDPEWPQVLLYDLTAEGTYELVAAKWFRPAAEVDAAPTLFGERLTGPRAGSVPTIPEHYGLTAWLFRENPEGLFSRYNPAIEPVPLVETVASVRADLRRYLGNRAATEDGYTNTETCGSSGRGFYGIPFVDDALVSSGGTDRSRPPILLYRITPNWAYQLVGAEWYVPADATDAPPSLFGFDFHEPMAAHSPKVDQPDHYGLHAWLFGANPRGMFSPFNPFLRC